MRVVGIDLEIGSSPNSKREARYSAFGLVGDLSHSRSNITTIQLIKFINKINPIHIATDNISELGTKTKLDQFMNSIEGSPAFVEVTKQANRNVSIQTLAKKINFRIFEKPNSIQTAEICARLCFHGIGSSYKWKTGQMHGWEPFEISKRVAIQTHHFELQNKEITPKVLNAFLAGFNKISKLTTMVGKGKEALVCVADVQSFGSSIIKVYQAYSPVAKEFRRTTPHVKGWNASIAMAKREAQILEYLNQRNINAPKFYFLEGPVLVMELILHEKKVAPMLSKVNLKNYRDPKEFLVEALDILLEMFELGSLVHGDFSPQNLLVSDEGLIPIDFQQSRKINTKFFTSTPKRIRIDDALKILRSDVITILHKTFS